MANHQRKRRYERFIVLPQLLLKILCKISPLQTQPRTLRTRPSLADESGGEEILYPRKPNSVFPEPTFYSSEETPKISRAPDHLSMLETNTSMSPPSAFNQSTRKARKRSSDEFEMDQTGSLVSKHSRSASTSKDKGMDDKAAVRKHRSLNVSTDGKSAKDRRRESSGITINSNSKAAPVSSRTPERHVRQTSVGSSSSNVPDSHHPRRVHTTDFSHLPPSPSSSSIQQFLRNTVTAGTSQPSSLHRPSKDNLQIHSSPNVAHSLLRGTQEGWSALDDEATAEALRKLDGLIGKGARARASVGSFGRPSSSSRPGTPSGKSGSQWEGHSTSDSGKSKRGSGNVKESPHVRAEYTRGGPFAANPDVVEVADPAVIATSSDEQSNVHVVDKTPKKSSGARLSFTPKRGSTSSTTYTSTPSSRDSASMSAATSVTSMSATSGRHSSNKGRRNSASSDISSVHSTDASIKDRVASIAAHGDGNEEGDVPPVPPLPKDLSTYRSPPTTSVGLTFPSISIDDKDRATNNEPQLNRTISLDVPPYTSPIISPPTSSSRHRESQYYSSNSANEVPPALLKTPSKKWSFSSALNLKLSGSPSSSSSQKSGFPLSPRSVTFGQQLRKSTSKDQHLSSSSTKGPWSPNQPDAMASAGSLASLSSIGSVRTPAQVPNTAKTPERPHHSSRPGTDSSANTASALSAPPAGALSPTSSIRRSHSKRLTPSSIPFFRRSSSQSMQLPPSNGTLSSSSPTFPGILSSNQPNPKQISPPSQDYNSISTSTPGTTHKKSSMLSLGLPSLLKSSSRRSLHADAKDAAKEAQRAKDAARELEKEKTKLEKERQKKEDKDRSESRISVIINRKRGKVRLDIQLIAHTFLKMQPQTLSSTDPRKPKSPVNLPPMQMAALEPVTAQRVAKLKSSMNSTPAASLSSRTSTSSTSSRLTSQTVSSMQKQSDTSLRSRNQLPTIAGSPSVGTTGTSSSQTLKDGRDPPSSLLNSTSGLPKETPTKIPRISSRTSAAASPPLKNSVSTLTTRRTSGLMATSSTNVSPTSFSTNEFGVMESEDGSTPKVRQPAVRGSPSVSTSRAPRQSSGPVPTVGTSAPRKSNRDSISFIGLRKSSTNSVASLSTPATTTEPSTSHHRFSVLSPSKGLKLLAPKTGSRTSTSGLHQSVRQSSGSPSSSRHSLSTPSPAPSTIDEDELLGDEEMLNYIRRQHAKKLASGASQEELDDMLKFPEPVPPGIPSSPASK